MAGLLNHSNYTTRLIPSLLILLLLAAGNAPASEEPVEWRLFKATEGLPESWSYYVTIGPRGKVWITHGSTDFNSWFDGWPDEEGKLAHQIPTPGYTYRMEESKYGQLWSLAPEGIKVYDDGKWQLTPFPLETSDEMINYTVVRIPFLPGDFNQIYLLLPDSLCSFDISRKVQTTLIRAAQTGIGKFSELRSSRDGGVWITGLNGILKYRPAFSEMPDKCNEYHPPWTRYRQFTAPVEQEDQTLYITALDSRDGGNDLLALKNGEWKIIDERSDSIVKGWPGLDGSYWLLKSNKQISHIGQDYEDERLAQELPIGQVRDVAYEGNGVFWLATDYGLARYSPPLWRVPFGMNAEDINVSAICEDESGRIWFMAKNRFHMYDNEHWHTYVVPDKYILPVQQSSTLFPVSGNKIGFRSHGGYAPVIFDAETKTYHNTPYTDPTGGSGGRVVHWITPAENGCYWFITYNSQDSLVQRLEYFDGEESHVRAEFQQMFDCRVLYIAQNGDIWLGSPFRDFALSVLHEEKYRIVGPDEGYTGGGIFCTHEFADGRVWTGGRDEIYEYDGSRWSLVRRGGMDNIYSICSSADGSAWVASVTGVHRYINGIWFTYGRGEGLPGTAANCVFEDSRGRVWAGTTNGIAVFHPEADIDPPEVMFLERDQFSEVPPSGNVHITFSAVDRWNLTSFEKMYFSYRIDNGEWSPFRAGNTAWYTNLPHGPHSFEVRAMDLNLNYSHYPARLDFTVLLPWYREAGFIAILIVSGIIILVSLSFALHHHFRVEALVRKRTDDLQLTNIKLLRSLRHEKLLADIASTFSNRSEFYENIGEFMGLLGDGIEISGVHLLERAGDGTYASIGHWNAATCTCAFSNLIPHLGASLRSIVERLEKGYTYTFSSFGSLSSGERELFSENNIRSAYILPVRTLDTTLGLLCFYRFDDHAWSDEEQKLFLTITGMLVNIWERHRHLQARLAAEKKHTQALQAVEQASRMASIGVIAAGITHEINQPLNNIKVISDIISFWNKRETEAPRKKYDKWLGTISENVRRISDIIQQMRSYWVSSPSNSAEIINLNDSVHSAVSLMVNRLEAHNIACRVLEETRSLRIAGNKINMEQIVLNMVVNAMHALDTMQRPDKQITISLAGDNGVARMIVTDNGPGIPRHAIGKIFDPFYSTKTREEGMGLGLAIVKRFVEEFGGFIAADQSVESGARFVIEFPIVAG